MVILLEKETKAFDNFWDEYDKKQGDKVKCKTKFLNMSEKSRKAVMDHIIKYKIAQPERKFRKNPEVFLNQKGWTHELLEEVNESNPTTLKGSW